jgi:hypothetical protein
VHDSRVYRTFSDGKVPYTRLPHPAAPTGANEPIVDHHILLVVYALQNEEALTRMRQLKWVLQQEQVAGQEVVLIERVPVHLIEAAELT